MTIHTTATPSAAGILWLCLCLLITAISPAQVPSQIKPGRTADYKAYLNYLNYHRARLDSEAHPDLARRKPAADHAAKLANGIDKLDIDALRTALRANAAELRHPAIIHISAENKILPAQLLDAEARLAALKDAAKKEDAERIETLGREVTWLRKRAEFFRAEHIALTGESAEGDRATGLFTALINLGEARVEAETLTDPEKKRRAEASFKLQSQRLGGETLEAAREALSEKQLRAAARDLGTRLRSLAATPGERQRLLALQKFYQQEIAALKAIHQQRFKARRGRE